MKHIVWPVVWTLTPRKPFTTFYCMIILLEAHSQTIYLYIYFKNVLLNKIWWVRFCSSYYLLFVSQGPTCVPLTVTHIDPKDPLVKSYYCEQNCYEHLLFYSVN